MKTMTAFAAILVAGMALAPMATSAATITFWAETPGSEDPDINIGSGSGSMLVTAIYGQDTPKNAGQSRTCIPACLLNYQPGGLLSSRSYYVDYDDQWPPDYIEDEWKWKGGGFLNIVETNTTDAADTTLLAGTFAEPVTETYSESYFYYRGGHSMAGILINVVIDDDLAAYYGVANRGTGEITVGATGPLPLRDYAGSVTFSPIPVPAALPLMLTALAGLGLIRWRRTQTA